MKHRPEAVEVKIKDIDQESIFYFGYFTGILPAETDAAKLGFVYNPLVMEKGSSLFLVSGGKRLAYLKGISAELCCVYIYRDLEKQDIPEIFLNENRHRFINSVEISKMTSYCEKMAVSVEPYVKSRIKRDSIIELSRRILDLKKENKDFLSRNSIPFNDLEMLIYFSDNKAGRVLDSLSRFTINGHKMKQILFNIYKAGLSRNFSDILDDIDSMASLEDVISFLNGQVNPFSSKKKSSLELHKKNIRKKYNIDLDFDPNFEDDKIRLGVNFKDVQSLQYLLKDEHFRSFISDYIEFKDE